MSEIVFYRILAAPPGYAPNDRYMVAEYETLDFASRTQSVTKPDGSKFAVSLDEAREMIPTGAERLPFEQISRTLGKVMLRLSYAGRCRPLRATHRPCEVSNETAKLPSRPPRRRLSGACFIYR